MSLLNSNQQSEISAQRRMPVDDIATDQLKSITSETVQFYYYTTAGVLTTDAGQAAGTVVVGKLANRNVKNALGDVVGHYGDTSVAITSTAFIVNKPFREIDVATAESTGYNKLATGLAKATAATAGFLNGQYCIDHRTGVLYGVKADNSTTLSANYKVEMGITGGGGGGLESDVNIDEIGGTAVAVDDSAMAATPPFLPVGGEYRLAATTYADGDATVLQTDVNGNLLINTGAGALDVEGNVAHDAADSGNPVKVGGRAVSAQIAAVAADDRTDFITNLYGEQVMAGHTWATNSNRVEEINPISQQYVAETLLALTNIAQSTTAYGYIDMAGVKYLGIQGETSGATPTDVLTVTLEATCQDDGTAPASCTYQDVTTGLSGVASWVDTDFFALIDTPLPVKYLRVKYVTSAGGGNDADLTVYTKKLY